MKITAPESGLCQLKFYLIYNFVEIESDYKNDGEFNLPDKEGTYFYKYSLSKYPHIQSRLQFLTQIVHEQVEEIIS